MPQRIVMCSDFFYPRIGGVEQHIWSLSQHLRTQGHHVAVVTGRYAAPAGGAPVPRVGVRYMSCGLRVYHLPHLPMADQSSFPTYFGLLPLFRAILLRERATVAHGHAATSVLTHDFLLCARVLGYPCVYTDHSLFGFTDFASINVNKYLSFALAGASAAVAVSRVSRENLCRRAGVPPALVRTIPNAVDGAAFRPPPGDGTRCAHTVVMLSRLVYRKGVDLAVEMIPRAAARWPRLRFLIGGDGPKRGALEAMVAAHGLGDRVALLGAVAHEDVPALLHRGALFLNCSLTESFCVAVLEAACAGCHVVSTPVGGVPEVLPPHMATLAAAPTADALLDALATALPRAALVDAAAQHAEAARLYAWPDVAARTAALYAEVASEPPQPLSHRFLRLAALGPVFGPVAAVLVALMHVMASALDWLCPPADVDPALPAPTGEELRQALDAARGAREAECALDAHLRASGMGHLVAGGGGQRRMKGECAEAIE
jgi:phosphatidylinositol glycan class A protein